ncbi:MAG: MFS transporter [Bryobacter sp.]|jgi:ACS family tartrate transporter-like MFS transporter|nr:MFS transporter [Bryobacter sp. CoA8 C33]
MLTTEQIAALRRKVAWRILPLVILLYLVAYLDRANVGFAKLRMAADLKFSDTVFGLGIGIFFIGYLTLEIPGALLVERWSARKWFSRILITWGLISAATAFVETPGGFYTARFLLGVAEAGFFPGILVYFTHWFPIAERGRAMSGLIVAVPFSLALGAPISAMLLDVNWFGLAGWQWLFILEGLPAVVLGVIVLFALTDRPKDAPWLTEQERNYLTGVLEAEAAAKEADGAVPIRAALRMPNVWLLSLGIFATNTGGYAMGFWLPTTVKNLSGGSDQSALLFSGLFYLCGLAGVLYSGFSSDRTGDRKWHCVAGQAGTGLLLGLSAMSGGIGSFGLTMSLLCLTGAIAYSWPTPFWALPMLTLTASAAAASIGLINIFANLAGYLGNHLVGYIRDRGATESHILLFLASWYLLGAVITSFVKVKRSR